MNWFRGTIPDAIAKAKSSESLFIVFVYDKSDLSTSFREKLNNEIVSNIFSSHIAIEIENGANDAKQFSQIYPLIVVPSLFCINPKNGIPLEVIGGDIEIESLVEKIKALLDANSEFYKKNERNEQSDPNTQKEMNSMPVSEESAVEENPTPANSTVENHIEDSERVGVSASDVKSEGVNLEQRVEKAKELLNKRQQQKAQEELEEEKRKEIERRRQQQELNLAKKKREEHDRDEIKKQRLKEKEEDRLARERVKAQIAADREERKKRSALLRGEYLDDNPVPEDRVQNNQSAEGSSSQITNQINNRDNSARIKFRFPDNSSEMGFFQADSTLGDVRTYLLTESKITFKNFKLVGTLPSRTFTDDQLGLTLRELDLVPSSIIIVKPISSALSISPSKGGSFSDIIWTLLAPFTLILNYLSSWFGSRSSHSSSSSSGRAAKRPRTEDSSNRSNERSSYYESGGNIHRLRRSGDDDDDDENNTWNGNSTQQM